MFLNQRGVSKGSTVVVPEPPPFHAWGKPIQNRDEMGLGIRLLLGEGCAVCGREPHVSRTNFL